MISIYDRIKSLKDPRKTLKDPKETLKDPEETLNDPEETLKDPEETLDLELGIFLDKADNNQEYEVLVIKSKKTDEYIPLEADNIKRFEDHGDSISFFFDSFDVALYFVDKVLPFHEEFQDRPIRPIL
jgi:hypothetical protein